MSSSQAVRSSGAEGRKGDEGNEMNGTTDREHGWATHSYNNERLLSTKGGTRRPNGQRWMVSLTGRRSHAMDTASGFTR